MKKLLSLFILINFATTSLHAQKLEKVKGNRIVSKLGTDIPSFSKIDLDEHFDIELLYAKTPSVSIETDENLHEVIEFAVIDSTLSFNFLKRITSKKRLKIQVNYDDALKELISREHASIKGISSIKTTDFKIASEGSSKISISLSATNFTLEGKDKSKVVLNLNGSVANLNLQNYAKLDAQINNDSTYVQLQQRANAGIDGNADSIEVLADNSSTLMGKNYTLKTAKVSANTSSTITLEVIDNITLEASGNSAVNIYGNPEIAVKRLVDTSKIQKKVR
ncbi:GIN domain-containing protein [Seonamhaeicola marinus]|uniref:DUF2807 domain-containing protein n=1 Tax=Seonamhaeicola marinus TaxID=1912246 RepID=A0A5D0IN51_9FLAO|nr:DUF2807 domain-containing protein [Seonamhaeicola marinus]TYA84290.1 DUF2807 domain-containing protein [Seonamhaeicola marinus]